MYSISLKLKSAFSMIGKTTADKLTSKLVGKSSRFRMCELIRTCGHEVKHVCEILNIFVLLDKFFCFILNENALLLNFLSHIFHLVAFIWEFYFLGVNSIFACWISAYFIYGDPVVCLFSVFASLEYIFFWFCSASIYLLRIELSWH